MPQALKKRNDALLEYRTALDEYTNNEYKFQQKYNILLDDCNLFTPGEHMYNVKHAQLKAELRKRRQERAKELHRLQQADEKLEKAKIEYGNAKHERNVEDKFSIMNGVKKGAKKLRMFGETVSGLSELDNIVNTETRASFKAKDSVAKQEKILDYMKQSTNEERELIDVANRLNNAYKTWGAANGKTDEEVANMFKADMDAIVKEGKRVNVSSTDIDTAINRYKTKHSVTKITEGDINGILDNLEDIFVSKNKDLHITNAIKDEVRKQFKFKKTNDNKGLGYDSKEAAEAIRSSLGTKGLIPPRNAHSVDPTIDALFKELIERTNRLNTHNEVGKIKHKTSVVNTSKIFSEIKKNRK